MDFAAEFSRLTGFSPLKWQTRLFTDCLSKGIIPASLDLPTGLGKTSVMAIWMLAIDSGAKLPRRLVYVVDRRAVVDQATTEAEKIKAASGDTALRISTLRGQHVDNREWLDDPAAPAIIVGTVDMIGSRLLFSGYGVSRKMRPFHAGLLGIDSLIVLDESHLVPPFERLMEAIETGTTLFGPQNETDREILPRFRLLSLSATGRERQGDAFSLNKDDQTDPIVNQRLQAKKRLTLVSAEQNKLVQKLTEEAWELSKQGTEPVRILIYCNERKVAVKVHAALEKRGKGIPGDNFQLLVGGRRVRERMDAARQLEQLGFLAGSSMQLTKPAFLVATSAGEVGVDLDADHMTCDLVPWERMVQRFGRVNRRGLGNARIIVVQEGEPKAKKAGEAEGTETTAIIAWRCCALFEELKNDDQGIDVSPGALLELKHRCAKDDNLRDLIEFATTPPPLYPPLTRALMDAWSMTSLEEHTGRPEIAPWLRGWNEHEDPRTVVVWRRYLPFRSDGPDVSSKEAEAFFTAAVPHLSEMLETESYQVHDWLKKRLTPTAEGIGTAAFVLNADGSLSKRLKLSEINSMDKKDAVAHLAGRTLVVDSRLGGLSQGLLEPGEKDEALAADNPESWQMEVSFLIEKVKGNVARQGAVLQFPLCISREGEVMEYLAISSRTSTEEGRSLASRPQLLEEHHSWTQDEIGRISKQLCLSQQYENALALASRKHDIGKIATCWQAAANAPDNNMYAKTAGPFIPSRLGGYRHEFGSLLAMLKDPELDQFPADLQDLILHLVATHHGRGRPVIPSQGCAEAPPSQLAAVVRDVALRHARLQKRWGPWGLAWWESLLRAADQRASRLNIERGAEHGQS